jgi:hypothetical protein
MECGRADHTFWLRATLVFKSFQSIISPSSRAGGFIRQRNNKVASTTFSDSTGSVIKVSFIVPGGRGNNYIANLVKITATKYRFRLYAPDGTRLNTVTEEDSIPPSTVIADLVDSINGNNTFKKYIHVRFIKESTEAFSTSTAIEDGQRLRGGR